MRNRIGRNGVIAVAAGALAIAACSSGDGAADSSPPVTAPTLQTLDGPAFPLLPPRVEYCGSIGPTHAAVLDDAGALAWTVEVPYVGFHRPVVGESFGWFRSTVNEQLGALDLGSGRPAWLWTSDDPIRGFDVIGDTLVVQTNRATIGLDGSTGAQRWTVVETAGPASQRTQLATSPLQTDLTALELRVAGNGDLVYLNEDGWVVARSVQDGGEVWRTATTGEFSYSPMLDGDILFHVAFEGRLYALDPATGDVRWTWDSRPGVAITDALRVTDDQVVVAPVGYLGNPDGVEPPSDAENLVALSRADGVELEPGDAVNLGSADVRRPAAGRIDPVGWPAGTAAGVWTDDPASSFARADGTLALVSNPPYGECA